MVAGLVVATAGGLELEDLPAIPNISLSTAVVAGLVVATAGGLELEDLPAIPNISLSQQQWWLVLLLQQLVGWSWRICPLFLM